MLLLRRQLSTRVRRPAVGGRMLTRRPMLRREQVAHIEELLHGLHSAVDRNHSEISRFGKLARQLWESEAGTVMALIVGRSVIYSWLADESEKLGKEVAQRNIKNVIATLSEVAKDPETLALLVQLLRELLADEATRRALSELLIQTFQDDELSQETGRFLLGALDGSDARKMLDEQTARLVSATVLDAQVQDDASVSVRKVLARALLPRALLSDPSKAQAG